MAYQQKLRLPDGQELALYNEGNTSQGSIRMDGESLTITGGGHSNVAISAGADLIFQGSTATIGGTSSILSLGNSGDTVALNVPGVTYQIGTVTGNTTFANDLTISGTLKPTTITGTVNVTDTIFSWARDTDYATLSYIDYGADNDQLTLDVGDRQTDYFRIRGANSSGTLTNVIDFSQAGVTSYVGVTATAFTEGSTLLSAKYLGISATAADSSKLGGVAASSYLRNDVAGTINANLTVNGTVTVGANNIIGSNSSYYLSLSSAGVTLSSVGSMTIVADSDNSSTTEYLSLKAGSDDLRVVSDGTITYNGNKVWHAGNDGAGSGLDADTLDGIDSTGFGKVLSLANSTDLNTAITSGFYRINDTPVNAPSGANWSPMIVSRNSDTIMQIIGGYSNGNLYYRAGNPTDVGGTGSWKSWAKVWTDLNDGSGSGLDADTVDGIEASVLMRTNANTSTTGTITIGTGTTSVLANQTDGSLRVSNTNGYIDIAPKNVSYAHIYTDRPSFYFNKDLLVNGNTVWHAGNDGTTSGLDADMVDGVHLTGLVQTSRTLTPGTGIQIDSAATAKDLSANRTISLDLTYTDGRYLGKTAKAADSDKLDNLDSTQFLRSDIDASMGANITFTSGEKYISFTSGSKIRSNATGSLIISSGNGTDSVIYLRPNGDLTTTSQAEIGNGYFRWNGNQVWTAGNDGAGSGLDADTVDGIQGASIVQTSRTVTAGTGLTGGGDLSGDITLSFDATYGDGRYLGKTAKAADSDKLDNLDSSQFVRSDVDDVITANVNINTNSNSRYLIISRNGSSTDEIARHGVDDGKYEIRYVNDEYAADMQWVVENTDTEASDGSRANTTTLRLTGASNPTLTLNNNIVWHAGNDGTGSGLDADLIDGVQLSGLVQTGRKLTGGSGIKIDTATGVATDLSADRSISLDTSYTDNLYLGKTAKAADSDKLDNLDSTQFVRNDSATTMNVGLLFSATATAGPTSASPTALSYGKLQSYGTFTIAADTDGSKTEYLNLAAGYASPANADGLSIGNTTLKWKGNDVWHAGNDGSGSGLDADTVDGYQASSIMTDNGSIANTVDWNTLTTMGVNQLNSATAFSATYNQPVGAYTYGALQTVRSSNNSIAQMYFPHTGTASNAIWVRTGWVGGTPAWQPWAKLWTSTNMGSGSGLDADTVDGVHGTSLLRKDQNDTFTGTLTISGSQTISGTLTASGNVDVAGVPSLSGWSGSYREGQKSNLISRMNGRLLNRNSDFIQNNLSGYATYDNAASNRVSVAIVSDDTIPNNTGKLMRVTYNAANNATKIAQPGFGGFYMGFNRTTGNPTTWGYKAGNRYVYRLVAKVPTGYNLMFAGNATGSGGGEKWLTSTAGTGNWQEYIYMQTIGNTGSFSTTGYFYIGGYSVWSAGATTYSGQKMYPKTTQNGFYYTASGAGTTGATEPVWPTTAGGTVVDNNVTWTAVTDNVTFTWDVAICQVIGIDEVPDTDRAPQLNVGYKATDLGWGEIYATGKITSDNSFVGTNFVASGTGGLYSNTNNSWFIPYNGSGNMHIKTGEGNKAMYIDSDTFQVRDSAGTSRLTVSAANNVTVTGSTTFNSDVTVGGNVVINKTGNWSYLVFPKQANDPGFIGHYENNNVSEMRFSVSDDADGTDIFTFGANPGTSSSVNAGTWTEGARITSAGVATFKGLTVNGTATVTGNLTTNGQLAVGTGNANGVLIGTNKLQSVASNELVILSDELRLGRIASAWDYSKWAGFKYDDTLNNFYIGGPASANFKESSTPVPKININFEGTTQSSFDGKVIINDAANSTIGGSTVANGWLQIGSSDTNKVSIDPNEIYFAGNDGIIGTIGAQKIILRPNSIDAVTLTSAGNMGVGNTNPSARVDVSGDVRISSGNSLWVGNITSGARARFHHNGTNAYIDFESGTAGTGDLYFRSGTANKFVMFANGNLAVNQSTASATLDVNGTITSNATVTGLNFTASAGSFTATGSNNGFVFPSGKKFFSNGVDNWIRTDTDLYLGSYILRTDGTLNVGSSGQLTVTPTIFNWNAGTMYSNTAGKLSINRASNPVGGHNLDVKSSGNNMGINLQANADTDVSGITFQNTGGNYTWHIARSAVAAADLNFYGGNSSTVTGIRTTPSVIFYNAGGAYFDGDITNKGNLMVRGNGGMTQTASITLALGDADTGLKWISDGKFQTYANNVATIEYTNTLTTFLKKVDARAELWVTTDGDNGARIQPGVANVYGFTSDYTGNNVVITNEQGTGNQAIFLGDTTSGSNTLLGISTTTGGTAAATTGSETWTKKFEVTGSGEVKTTDKITIETKFSIDYNSTEDSLDFVYNG
jgi:hypothetical protein